LTNRLKQQCSALLCLDQILYQKPSYIRVNEILLLPLNLDKLVFIKIVKGQ